MKEMLLVLGLCLAASGCSGDRELGEVCDDENPCEASLDCIPLAIGCLDDCQGTCEKPCESNADCGSDQFCTASRGREYCVDEDFSPN